MASQRDFGKRGKSSATKGGRALGGTPQEDQTKRAGSRNIPETRPFPYVDLRYPASVIRHCSARPAGRLLSEVEPAFTE